MSRILENLENMNSIVFFLILICTIVAYGAVWSAVDFISGEGSFAPISFTVTASSQHKSYGGPRLAFDDTRGTWHTATKPTYPQWIKCEFSKQKKITSLAIQAQTHGTNNRRAPKDFVLQASNDDRNYTDLLKVTDDVYTKPGQWHHWKVKNDKKYKFYRIYITKNGGAPNYLSIQEIKMT